MVVVSVTWLSLPMMRAICVTGFEYYSLIKMLIKEPVRVKGGVTIHLSFDEIITEGSIRTAGQLPWPASHWMMYGCELNGYWLPPLNQQAKGYLTPSRTWTRLCKSHTSICFLSPSILKLTALWSLKQSRFRLSKSKVKQVHINKILKLLLNPAESGLMVSNTLAGYYHQGGFL